ncbi:ribokinase [Lachnospiraceae bacterium 42-17]
MKKTITVVGHYGMSLLMDVGHFPAVGETVEGLGLETEPGGKGYNQAIAASRLGADVNFITAVGGDDFGGRCEPDLISEKVGGRYIIQFPDLKTACAFVINNEEGKSEVYVYPGAIRHVTSEHIRRYTSVIQESSLMLLQNEVTTEALSEVMKIAGRAGIEIIYNPAPARKIPPELFPYITILTPNETEAAILAGMDPERPLDVDKALDILHGLGAANVIITMGGQGSIVSGNEGRFHVGALKGKVINTTGAGDCYNAALSVKYLEAHSIIEAAEYAAIAAGMQVMMPGVIANMPYKDEVDEVFRKVKGTMISDL